MGGYLYLSSNAQGHFRATTLFILEYKWGTQVHIARSRFNYLSELSMCINQISISSSYSPTTTYSLDLGLASDNFFSPFLSLITCKITSGCPPALLYREAFLDICLPSSIPL